MSKILLGRVLKAKMQKTIVLGIDTKTPHPKYKKLVKKTTKLLADIDKFEPKVGEFVKIQETRPMSKRKNFKVIEVIQK